MLKITPFKKPDDFFKIQNLIMKDIKKKYSLTFLPGTGKAVSNSY